MLRAFYVYFEVKNRIRPLYIMIYLFSELDADAVMDRIGTSLIILQLWTDCTEAKFLDVIGTKELRVFLIAIPQSPLLTNLHPPPLRAKMV